MDDLDTSRQIYFIGCDMGGWHTDRKDAIAACKWDGKNISPAIVLPESTSVTRGGLFYPLTDDGPLWTAIQVAKKDHADLIIAIDAALSWPVLFLKLALQARRAGHVPTFSINGEIDNPYLFRETERFIREYIKTDKNPFSAPGQSFGNNCSKAQALVGWLKSRLVEVYRPPFDKWDKDVASKAHATIIEVYPASCTESEAFGKLRWQCSEQPFCELDNDDPNDAKRCAMVGVCYAASLCRISAPGFATVVLPDDPRVKNAAYLRREGWIFAPEDRESQKGD